MVTGNRRYGSNTWNYGFSTTPIASEVMKDDRTSGNYSIRFLYLSIKLNFSTSARCSDVNKIIFIASIVRKGLISESLVDPIT